MKIHVRLFAILKDRAGVGELDLSLEPGATIHDAQEKLLASHPDLGAMMSRAAFALNREYGPRTTPLKDGDELAIIPPVSGGAP